MREHSSLIKPRAWGWGPRVPEDRQSLSSRSFMWSSSGEDAPWCLLSLFQGNVISAVWPRPLPTHLQTRKSPGTRSIWQCPFSLVWGQALQTSRAEEAGASVQLPFPVNDTPRTLSAYPLRIPPPSCSGRRPSGSFPTPSSVESTIWSSGNRSET